MNEIIKIKYKGQYVFHVEFDDGTNNDVDLAEYIEKGPIFKPLRDINFFKLVGCVELVKRNK